LNALLERVPFFAGATSEPSVAATSGIDGMRILHRCEGRRNIRRSIDKPGIDLPRRGDVGIAAILVAIETPGETSP
jgi:hypothetical protein